MNTSIHWSITRVVLIIAALAIIAPVMMETLRNLWLNWGWSHPYWSTLAFALFGALSWWLFGTLMYFSDPELNKQKPPTPQPLAVQTPAYETLHTPSAIENEKKGPVPWDFSGFLGGSGSDLATNEPKFRIIAFQTSGRNTWSAPITKLDAYIEIDRTGERFRVQLNTSGTPTDLAKLDSIASQGRVGVVAFFTQDADYSAWNGLEPNAFISRYTPFTFIVSINGGEERRYRFSTEQCREKIQAFIDASLKPLP